ncbi:Uncharacterised protein [uncultured archaeon]|nr:Uncharacterised protein [uncultured archaeon]
MDKKTIVTLIAILMFMLPVFPASAQSISYTDVTCLNLDWGCSSKLYIYYSNQTLAGTLNGTNDVLDIDTSQPIQLVIKPASASLMNNPFVILPWVLNMFQAIIVLLFAIAVVAAIIYMAKRLVFGRDNSSQQGWGKWRRQ